MLLEFFDITTILFAATTIAAANIARQRKVISYGMLTLTGYIVPLAMLIVNLLVRQYI